MDLDLYIRNKNKFEMNYRSKCRGQNYDIFRRKYMRIYLLPKISKDNLFINRDTWIFILLSDL